MTNFEKIKTMDMKEMASFLNDMIENGSRQLADELEACGITEIGDGLDECVKWLGIDAGITACNGYKKV